jgi:hypothetical protein
MDAEGEQSIEFLGNEEYIRWLDAIELVGTTPNLILLNQVVCLASLLKVSLAQVQQS